MKKATMSGIILLLLFIVTQPCFGQHSEPKNVLVLKADQLKFEVNPESFFVAAVDSKGKRYTVSAAIANETISDLKQDETHLSWKFPKKGISVMLELHKDFLDIEIKADSLSSFTWPLVQSKIEAFTIPLHQGKYIPSQDVQWIRQMVDNSPLSGSQDLSMQFFATNIKDLALVYVIKNMFNNELHFFNNEGTLGLKFNHEFPETVKDKRYGFRIYLTANNPTAIAKTYKKYVEEAGKIITLEEKARDNPNIRKLYGAAHIYIWNDKFIVTSDITNWKALKGIVVKALSTGALNPTKHLFNLFNAKEAESGKAFLNQLTAFKKEEFVTNYHKNLLTSSFNEALLRKDFYNPAAWKDVPLNNDALRLIAKGVNTLNAVELYRLYKLLFAAAYPQMLVPMQDWGGAPPAMLDEMQTAGIKKAWLGLNDWVPGEIHPEFIEKATESGYLIGPYDSYHSMHPPGQEKWLTAKFEDTTLYTNAFVRNKNGKPAGGFLGAGRKLNPVLAFPAVKNRLSDIMKNTGHEFNSWFIDCDATGECLDDYSPGRMTNQQQDIAARLQRMSWIRDTYKLVIGSEDGNDFAAGVIAYAHGMTTPVVAWSDPDMRKNKESKYYVGSYFSNDGGIPSRYALQVPLKDKYLYTYFDNRFNLPLFQLVYNNSVITSHHWEWNSLKVPEEIKNTELKELLYNVPPLYHLDQKNWNKFKSIIANHVRVFSKTHEKAVKLEMTGFDWLTTDRLVQRTMFGEELEVVANFGISSFTYKGKSIPAKALVIHDLASNEYQLYKP